MARETRIGIALMVLLVGVFGAIVYKKWNGREPTALVAAAEGNPTAASDNADSDNSQNAVQSATPSPISVIGDENPFPSESFAETSPFERQSPPPVTQAEPTTVAAAEQAFPFEEVGSPTGSPSEISPATPPKEQPTSLFADAPPANIEPGVQAEPEKPANAIASSESLPAASAPSSPFIDDDPFAATVETTPATNAETAQSVDTTVANMEPLEDPFAAPIATGTDAPPANAAPVGNVASSAQPESSVASPPAATEVVEAEIDELDDPFADAPAETAAPSQPAAPLDDTRDVASSIPSPPASEDPLTADSGAPQEFVPDETATTFAGFDEEFQPASELDSGSSTTSSSPSPDTATGAATASLKADYHVVAENESYWTISKKVYGTPAYYHALAQFNIDRIKDPNRLRAGWKVLTPPASELKAKFPALVANVPTEDPSSSTTAASSKTGFVLDAQGRPCYRVGDSDTLGGIAQVHLGRASRWVQIYELNRASIKDPKSIRPGTLLRLPPDASRVRLVPEG